MQVDSCAHTAHRLWNPLWPDRRALGHLVIGANRPSSRMLLAGMAAAQETIKATGRLRSLAGQIVARGRGLAGRPALATTAPTRPS
jgi:hypothetical protein